MLFSLKDVFAFWSKFKVQVSKAERYVHRYSLTKRKVCVAWKQVRKIILFGLLARPQCFTEPYKWHMFPGNLNGHERETWWFEGFLGILKVQVYCIAKKGKSCWRWPGASGERTPARWFIMQLFFIIANELYVFSFGRDSGVT